MSEVSEKEKFIKEGIYDLNKKLDSPKDYCWQAGVRQGLGQELRGAARSCGELAARSLPACLLYTSPSPRDS